MFYNSRDTSSNNKRKVYIPLLLHFCLCTTGQTGCKKTLRIPVRPVQQNLRGCNSALKCATRQLSNLVVSIHDFPLLCIPADKFDAAGAKIHVWVP